MSLRAYCSCFVSAVVAGGMVAAGCGAPQTAGAAAPETESSSAEPEAAIAVQQGNPFEGVSFFVPTYTNADQARRRAEREQNGQAALLSKIADTPQARWLGGWSGDIETVTQNYVNAAHRRRKAALLVAYNIPNRDCGQYSSGGATTAAGYRKWVAGLAAGIGKSRRAVVVLEPDALALLDECLSPNDQQQRLTLLREAVAQLEALPGVAVYLDAGHSSWVQPEEMARRLKAAGVLQARGFALNVSNYRADPELFAYGDKIVQTLGATHYLIDSSRNGNGPSADSQWCNPAGRALGRAPTPLTGHPNLDAFAWIKNPGESDGECAGGPPAGQWFQARALELAANAQW